MSEEWSPDPAHPAFTVQRPLYGDVEGGDYARAGEAGLPKAAVRFAVEGLSSQEIAEQSSLVAFVRSYDTIDLTWGWPPKFDGWDSIALVRSGFGHPSTVNDGVAIFQVPRTAYAHVDSEDNPLSVVVSDAPLQQGRWYYYTLFFFTGNEWVPALYTEALVPRDFQHRDHLWNVVPPYYRFVDGQFRGEHGFLRQFLNTFGFELDMTREYVESWQEAYHSDFSPVSLLKRAGENLGLPFESGLGEIRYRAMVGQLAELYQWRGTPEGIRLLVEAASKYESLVSVGRNMLLLPDDSQFATGSGNWVLPALDEDIVVTAPFATDDRIEGYGRGVLKVAVAAGFGTGDVTLRCGHGVVMVGTEQKLLTPKFNGVPVEEGYVYGFSVQYTGPTTGTGGIRWYDRDEVFISEVDLLTPSPGDWQILTVQGEPPVGAAYAVPYVVQTARTAGDGFMLMGAMFYNVGPAGSVVALSPDWYMTLGDEDELLGGDTVIGGG